VASGCFLFAGSCAAERREVEAEPASQRFPPARVATFTVPRHGLASGAGSDGRVKGATLAGLLRCWRTATGRVVRRCWRRALCAPEALAARWAVAGRASARRSGAIAERSIQALRAERADIVVGAKNWGRGARRRAERGGACPPPPAR
jgi:hypothetical protein